MNNETDEQCYLTANRQCNRNRSRPRSIEIEFPDEASKWRFIKRANCTLRCKIVFVKLEKSKKKRDQQYASCQKVKELTNDRDTYENRTRNFKMQKRKLQCRGLASYEHGVSANNPVEPNSTAI